MVRLRFPKSPFRGGAPSGDPTHHHRRHRNARRSTRSQRRRHQHSGNYGRTEASRRTEVRRAQEGERDNEQNNLFLTGPPEAVAGTGSGQLASQIPDTTNPNNLWIVASGENIPADRQTATQHNTHRSNLDNNEGSPATVNQSRPFEATEHNTQTAAQSPSLSAPTLGLRRMFSSSGRKKGTAATSDHSFETNVSGTGISASFRRAKSVVVHSIVSARSSPPVLFRSSSFSTSFSREAGEVNIPSNASNHPRHRMTYPVDRDRRNLESPNRTPNGLNSFAVTNIASQRPARGENLNNSLVDIMNGMVDHHDFDQADDTMNFNEDPLIATATNHTDGGVVRRLYETEECLSPLAPTQSEEENVPPLSLLSPNSGTYYAHSCLESQAILRTSSVPSISLMDIDVNSRLGDHGNSDTVSIDLKKIKKLEPTARLPSKNVLGWMKDDAPSDILPMIFSYCGSRRMNALSRVSKAWNALTHNEFVWRVVCEDTHKWVEGDAIPLSWSQFYKDNPSVPIDYDNVDAAFDFLSSGPRIEANDNHIRHVYREQRRTARILLYPGSYFLRRSLVFNCVGETTFTIESVQGFKDPEHASIWFRNYHDSLGELSQVLSPDISTPAVSTPSREIRRSSSSLRHIFGCRSSSAAIDTGSSQSTHHEFTSSASSRTESSIFFPGRSAQRLINRNYNMPHFEGQISTPFLILESRRKDEPVIRVRQGTVHLQDLKFLHYCSGADIWNGNAAIQVQSPFGEDGRPISIVSPSVPPTAIVSRCDIMSMSGRGFVNIDGGISRIDNCNIHNSAATGIYVGGTGSVATITHTDVIENGNGNERHRRGVARGHSGIYVEQGIAKVVNCNISKNSLTGISAVSSDNATLQVEDSDLVSNGSVQLEMPPIGSPSRGRSFSRNNNISATGNGCPRSTYVKQLVEAGACMSPAFRHFPPLPQSPSLFPDDNVTRASVVRDDISAVRL